MAATKKIVWQNYGCGGSGGGGVLGQN